MTPDQAHKILKGIEEAQRNIEVREKEAKKVLSDHYRSLIRERFPELLQEVDDLSVKERELTAAYHKIRQDSAENFSLQSRAVKAILAKDPSFEPVVQYILPRP